MFQLLIPRYLAPDGIINRFDALDVVSLTARGIRGAVIDYDGVIASYDSLEPPCAKYVLKLSELRNAGVRVVILSNRRGEFSRSIEKNLPGHPVITSNRMKPHREPYEKALLELQTRAEETVLIEDRLITGIAGGNRTGFYTILVAYPEGDMPFKIRALCAIERFLLRSYIVLGLVQKKRHQK